MPAYLYLEHEYARSVLHCTVDGGVAVVVEEGGGEAENQEAKFIECWPCPPFDILLNKYFPAV